MTRLAVIVLAFIAVAIVAARCERQAGAQTPDWSSFRAVAQAPITCTLSRAAKDDAGHVVGRWENLGTIPAQADDRVLDEPLEAGWQYLMDCHFTVVDPVTYESWVYLPVTVRGFRRWEWLLR